MSYLAHGKAVTLDGSPARLVLGATTKLKLYIDAVGSGCSVLINTTDDLTKVYLIFLLGAQSMSSASRWGSLQLPELPVDLIGGVWKAIASGWPSVKHPKESRG